jgi:hypothetical protein
VRRPFARSLGAKLALFRTLQEQTLNVSPRRRITQNVPFGLDLEGLTRPALRPDEDKGGAWHRLGTEQANP